MARRPGWSTEFLNDGGPLIVLPRELLVSWMGGEGEPTSQEYPFGPDYTRACEAEYPAALVDVEGGFGLVIGAQDVVYPAQWVTLPYHNGVALVGWMYGGDDSESQVEGILSGDQPGWRCLNPQIDLLNGDLVLIHAADVGAESNEVETFGEQPASIGDAIPFRLAPGAYRLEVMEIDGGLKPGTFGCVLCRWLRADR